MQFLGQQKAVHVQQIAVDLPERLAKDRKTYPAAPWELPATPLSRDLWIFVLWLWLPPLSSTI